MRAPSFAAPRHPYTRALLESVPRADRRYAPGAPRVLTAIGGRLPDLADPPRGCRFHPRCPDAIDGVPPRAAAKRPRSRPATSSAASASGSAGRPDLA